MTLRMIFRRWPKQDFNHLPDPSRIWVEQELGVTRRGKDDLYQEDGPTPKRPVEDPNDDKFPRLMTQ